MNVITNLDTVEYPDHFQSKIQEMQEKRVNFYSWAWSAIVGDWHIKGAQQHSMTDAAAYYMMKHGKCGHSGNHFSESVDANYLAKQDQPVFVMSHTSEARFFVLFPPRRDLMEKVSKVLLKDGFKQQANLGFTFIHKQRGVKVSPSGQNAGYTHGRGLRAFARTNKVYKHDRNHPVLERIDELDTFLEEAKKVRGESTVDKSLIQNLILEEVKKRWPGNKPRLRRTNSFSGEATLTYENGCLIADESKVARDAYPDTSHPFGRASMSVDTRLIVRLSDKTLDINTQMGLCRQFNISWEDPWMTPENIMAVLEDLFKIDLELYDSYIVAKRDVSEAYRKAVVKLSDCLQKDRNNG